MDHQLTSGQGGTPMRQYHPLLEQYGVVAVFSGHSEMFERSFVDNDGNNVGVHYYDVGIAGDGLLGEKRTSAGFADNRLQYNPFSRWSADEHEAEVWAAVDGVDQLVAGADTYAVVTDQSGKKLFEKGASSIGSYPFTPPETGSYLLTLQGTNSYGEYTIGMGVRPARLQLGRD
jgi:hypothetical protein